MTVIPQLERDLLAAAAKRNTRRRFLPRRRRANVAVALAALVVVGGAGAATGVLSVGSVFRGEGFRPDSKRSVTETVVARGEVPVSGPWRMTAFETRRGVPCLKLELLDPPSAVRRRSSGYCGYFSRFSEFGHGKKPVARRRGEVLLFGRAPAKARRVILTAGGGKQITAPTKTGPPKVPGRFWVLAAPPHLNGAELVWTDRNGRRGERPLDVSYRFEGPTGRVVVAKGTAPLTGPWRMTIYESRGSVTDEGDLYEPEGLPGIELSLPDPRGSRPKRGGGSGLIRNAPGFSRGQTTLRAGQGSIKDKALGIVLYGRAPARADHVRIAAAGVRLLVKTRKGPPGVPGRFWFIATSHKLRNGHMRWVDTSSGEEGPAVAVLPP